MIGVPMPSARAAWITLQPSRPGSMRSSTTTSGRSKRSRASPCSPLPTTTGVLPVLEDVKSRLADSAERADVTILIEAAPEVGLPLRRRMLQVVVENLAQNAIRYAGPGSTLTLSARPGTLEASDDGRGVEVDELPRLLERFYRSDRARASRGTGLGLAIVKHVVGSAGGEVQAAGGPGQGLRVICSFPAREPVSGY